MYYAYIVLVALVTWFIATAGFNYTGARIARRIKIRFFAATLKQNMALAFWQGARRITEGSSSFTAVVTIAMVAKAAAFCVLGVGANVEAFSLAVAGARRLNRMIQRISPIDSSSNEVLSPSHFSLAIELRNIRHIYPCRPSTTVLDDVSIKFPAGKTTALVGHLLLRFYDPIAGEVLLDGKKLAGY